MLTGEPKTPGNAADPGLPQAPNGDGVGSKAHQSAATATGTQGLPAK